MPTIRFTKNIQRHVACPEACVDGTTLACGTTTGNLFASTDAGAHWTQLSCTLPPVYCVQLVD